VGDALAAAGVSVAGERSKAAGISAIRLRLIDMLAQASGTLEWQAARRSTWRCRVYGSTSAKSKTCTHARPAPSFAPAY